MKYWDMTADEFARVREGAKKRKKKADEYKPFILECLRKYPDMSAAQINDWLLEMTGRTKMPFGERSLRSYVENLRKEYEIKKPDKTRQHEAVDDPAYGDQGQVDLGEITLKKEGGGHKKIYGFAMVLSNSRYKFVCWQAQPFTTASFVEAHIKAFKYFGGRPRELVYDQDKVLAVSENHGDIIYTEGFQNYLNAVGFNVFLCRGSDPQSKGRVEAVIKYAKNNGSSANICILKNRCWNLNLQIYFYK
jgi:transposase